MIKFRKKKGYFNKKSLVYLIDIQKLSLKLINTCNIKIYVYNEDTLSLTIHNETTNNQFRMFQEKGQHYTKGIIDKISSIRKERPRE